MNRSVDIIAVLMLMVYGTLALVAVPMHQHTLEYVDTPQYHSVTVNHSVECSLCTFSTTSFVDGIPALLAHIECGDDSPVITTHRSPFSAAVDFAVSRRGPPSLLL